MIAAGSELPRALYLRARAGYAGKATRMRTAGPLFIYPYSCVLVSVVKVRRLARPSPVSEGLQ